MLWPLYARPSKDLRRCINELDSAYQLLCAINVKNTQTLSNILCVAASDSSTERLVRWQNVYRPQRAVGENTAAPTDHYSLRVRFRRWRSTRWRSRWKRCSRLDRARSGRSRHFQLHFQWRVDHSVMLGAELTIPVDGGHRAIKYTRIGGVKKEIYNEGTSPASGLPLLY